MSVQSKQEPARGYSVVHRDAATINGLLFQDLPLDGGRCCLVMPNGRVAMNDRGDRPFVYQSTQHAIDDSHTLHDILKASE